MKIEKKLTSVHILDSIYKKFKINTIESDINLQKFVNRSIDMYNNDPEFRKKIDNYKKLSDYDSKF